MRAPEERYRRRVSVSVASAPHTSHRSALGRPVVGALCASVLASIFAVACHQRDESPPLGDASAPAEGDAGAPTPPEEDDVLTLTTYNTGLAVVVRGTAQRLAAMPSALAALRTDVLCLQEAFAPVTSPEDMAALLADAYPYSVVPSVADTATTSGLVLVSRLPLEATDEYVFEQGDPAGLTDRLVLGAKLEFQGRDVQVLCTHLVSGLDDEGTASRRAQADELVQWAQARGALDEDTVLLGDFNAGPDPIGKCTADSSPACLEPDVATYGALLEAFDDPFADATFCTQCRDVFLPLQLFSLFDDEPDQRIDHCMVARASTLDFRSGGVVLGGDPDLTFGSAPLRTLSDHLGVTCSFE